MEPDGSLPHSKAPATMKPQGVTFMCSSRPCYLGLTWDVKDRRHSWIFANWISLSEIKIKPQKTNPILLNASSFGAFYFVTVTKTKTWSINMWHLSVIATCHNVYCQLWCSMTKFRNAEIILVIKSHCKNPPVGYMNIWAL